MTVETGYSSVRHSCSTDDVMKGKSKQPRQWPEWRRLVKKEPKFSFGPHN